MAENTSLLALINAYIKKNGNQEITGPVLNGVLRAIAYALSTPFIGEDGYWYAYNAETGVFEKTDTPAQGPVGPVGVTEVYANLGGTSDNIPAVTVDKTGTRLDFTFFNLKGDKGNTGDPGITNAVVTVDATIGTPSVSANIQGTTLYLAFSGLKGEQGIQGIQGVSIQSVQQVTTSIQSGGTNVIRVTLDNGQTFDFQVMNGQQGNSGYQGAAGELEIVNNLSDGGATKALSAEMGKTLDTEVSQLSQELYGGTPVAEIPVVFTEGKYLNANGTTTDNAGSKYTADAISLSGISKVAITLTTTGTTSSRRTLFFDSGGNVVANYQEGDLANQTTEIDTSNYASMKVSCLTGATVSVVGYGEQTTGDIQDLQNRVSELEETVEPIPGEIDRMDLEIRGGSRSIQLDFIAGAYYGTTGQLIENSGSKYTDKIDVSMYDRIVLSGVFSGTSSRATLFYTENEELVGELILTEEQLSASNTFEVQGFKYIAISLVSSSSAQLVGYVDGEIGAISEEVDAVSSDVAVVKEKTDSLSIHQSANLFNPDDEDVVIGGYITGNRFYENSAYNVSGYIPVAGGTTYYAANGTVPYRFAEYYDSAKAYISGDVMIEGTQFTTPASCAFVRVSVYADRFSTAQVAETQTDYVAYSRCLEVGPGTTPNSIARLADISELNGNVLFGKKWVACGDSFTQGAFDHAPVDDYHITEGPYEGQLKVYPYIIGNRNGMNVLNLAVGGSTMTYINGQGFSMANGRYTQIPSDADYITLKFGINDDTIHQSAPIGTINDATNETFYGAWNVVLDYIITNHPQAKIGIIVTNGSQLPYVNATIAIAEKWGIPYLNEATDKQCSFMFRSNRTDVLASVRTLRNNHWFVEPDLNSHPNAKAHEYESTVVEAWLRTL